MIFNEVFSWFFNDKPENVVDFKKNENTMTITTSVWRWQKKKKKTLFIQVGIIVYYESKAVKSYFTIRQADVLNQIGTQQHYRRA